MCTTVLIAPFILAYLFEGLEQIPLSLVIRVLNGR